MPRELSTLEAREMAEARQTFGAGSGRPRIKGPRCPCKVMTLKRAKARGPSSEHEQSCSFYRQAKP
jgi:hypothetical protein